MHITGLHYLLLPVKIEIVDPKVSESRHNELAPRANRTAFRQEVSAFYGFPYDELKGTTLHHNIFTCFNVLNPRLADSCESPSLVCRGETTRFNISIISDEWHRALHKYLAHDDRIPVDMEAGKSVCVELPFPLLKNTFIPPGPVDRKVFKASGFCKEMDYIHEIYADAMRETSSEYGHTIEGVTSIDQISVQIVELARMAAQDRHLRDEPAYKFINDIAPIRRSPNVQSYRSEAEACAF